MNQSALVTKVSQVELDELFGVQRRAALVCVRTQAFIHRLRYNYTGGDIYREMDYIDLSEFSSELSFYTIGLKRTLVRRDMTESYSHRQCMKIHVIAEKIKKKMTDIVFMYPKLGGSDIQSMLAQEGNYLIDQLVKLITLPILQRLGVNLPEDDGTEDRAVNDAIFNCK